MCYDVKTSAIAYTIAIMSSIAAYRLNHPVIAALIGTYSGVQLAEGVIWHGIDTENRTTNQIGTRMLGWNLSMHAVITVTAAIYFGIYNSRSRRANLTYSSMAVKKQLFVLWAISVALMVIMKSTTRHNAETYPSCILPKVIPASASYFFDSNHAGLMPAMASSRLGLNSSSGWNSGLLCRLQWKAFLNSSTLGWLYAAQVAIIMASLCIVYRHAMGIWCAIALFYGILFVGLVAISAVYYKDHSKVDRQMASHIAMSTMWCFGAAVGAPLVVMWLWWLG